VPVSLKVSLQVSGIHHFGDSGGAGSRFAGERSDLHLPISTRTCSTSFPWRARTSGLSSLVTLSTPGIAADSNGLFHGIGDPRLEFVQHPTASRLPDQQSKVVFQPAPGRCDREHGSDLGRTAGGIRRQDQRGDCCDTRSGQGVTTPHGSVTVSYGVIWNIERGSRGGVTGGKNWGNFISANGLNTGRFLDSALNSRYLTTRATNRTCSTAWN